MSTELRTPDTTAITDQVYQLGGAVFSLKNCDPVYKAALERLLPHYPGEAPEVRYRLDTGCSKDVPVLIRHMATFHHQLNCVWIEASCLLSANQKKVLITGPARCGKSTTTMALSLGKGWKVLSEHFCTIDFGSNKILNFLAPASLDDQSIELLKRIGVDPEPKLALEWRKNRVWSPTIDLTGDTESKPAFDVAIWLERGEESDSTLSKTVISYSEFARKTMPISNLLKLKGSYELFVESLASARCLTLSNGELEQRLEAIIDAVNS